LGTPNRSLAWRRLRPSSRWAWTACSTSSAE
jgi:hypothetical protein